MQTRLTTFSKTGVLLCAASLLASCSAVKSYQDAKKKVDYRHSEEETPLEVPPGLDSSNVRDLYQIPGGSVALSEYESGQTATPKSTAVLPKQRNIQVMKDSHQRWLEIKAVPDEIWPQLREFWLQNGLLIEREDPEAGIMETNWAENRAEISAGPIRNLISKAFDSIYSTGTRDKFRIRLERSNRAGITELYLTHRRMEEVPSGDTFIWQPHPSNPELEAELLNRLMSFMGMEQQRASSELARSDKVSAVERARLIESKSGERSLKVLEGFARTWRRTGHALDRIGFTVEDRNRSEGLYYVHYIDPFKEMNSEKKGWLDKMKFWKKREIAAEGNYQIHIQAGGEQSHILIRNEQGQPENSKTARRILKLLQEQLR